MKREFLKGLKLEDDQIDAIMAEHGKDVEASKSQLAELTTETESLKTQIADRDKDIKSLKKDAGDNEGLSKQLTELQDKYKTDTETLTNQLSQTKLNSALTTALTGAKARNPKAVEGLLDMDKVKLTDDGKLEGLDDQLTALRKTDGYLFDGGKQTHYDPAGGQGSDDSDQVQTLVDAFK
ncbi:phage scaffolding protein [Levilactobacillus angrenensis]|uniref:Phage scaffolding protein n=1 Tax=Levilactobacillus angrenensis TaxID=2486020 RepID=A0ABW1UBW7_9LACO|nr:phage scaffolding protein [Levilactobacillus angrenensis]